MMDSYSLLDEIRNHRLSGRAAELQFTAIRHTPGIGGKTHWLARFQNDPREVGPSWATVLEHAPRSENTARSRRRRCRRYRR